MQSNRPIKTNSKPKIIEMLPEEGEWNLGTQQVALNAAGEWNDGRPTRNSKTFPINNINEYNVGDPKIANENLPDWNNTTQDPWNNTQYTQEGDGTEWTSPNPLGDGRPVEETENWVTAEQPNTEWEVNNPNAENVDFNNVDAWAPNESQAEGWGGNESQAEGWGENDAMENNWEAHDQQNNEWAATGNGQSESGWNAETVEVDNQGNEWGENVQQNEELEINTGRHESWPQNDQQAHDKEWNANVDQNQYYDSTAPAAVEAYSEETFPQDQAAGYYPDTNVTNSHIGAPVSDQVTAWPEKEQNFVDNAHTDEVAMTHATEQWDMSENQKEDNNEMARAYETIEEIPEEAAQDMYYDDQILGDTEKDEAMQFSTNVNTAKICSTFPEESYSLTRIPKENQSNTTF